MHKKYHNNQSSVCLSDFCSSNQVQSRFISNLNRQLGPCSDPQESQPHHASSSVVYPLWSARIYKLVYTRTAAFTMARYPQTQTVHNSPSLVCLLSYRLEMPPGTTPWLRRTTSKLQYLETVRAAIDEFHAKVPGGHGKISGCEDLWMNQRCA